MPKNTKDYTARLATIAWTLVTPQVQADLDSIADPALGIRIIEAEAEGATEIAEALKRDTQLVERQRRLRELIDEHRRRAGCTLETSRRHISTALRRRRGERIAAHGGARPGAGAPAGNRNAAKDKTQ